MAVYGHGYYGRGVYGANTDLALTVQDIYPDRVLLTVNNLYEGLIVTITRRKAGETTRTTVRSADAVPFTSDAIVRNDLEAPYGIQLTYTLTINGVDYTTEVTTLTLDGGNVALSDAITGASAEVVILAWPEKKRERPNTTFQIGGRNVVVVGERGGFAGSIDIFTDTDDGKNNLLNLIQNATSGILQIRQPGPYDGVDAYVAVLADTETRWSQDGSDGRRIITLDVVETGPWAPTLESSTFTLLDINNAFPPPDDLADLNAAYPTTLLAIATGNFS